MTHIQKIRDFLDPGSCKAIRDPVWHHIHLPDAFNLLLGEDSFRKLQGIRQLGPSYLVYPGATHSRFNHSLGVFHVAKRFMERLLAEPEFRSFFSESGGRAFLCAALVHDLGHFPYTHSLKELPLNDHETLTAELVCTGRLATLLRAHGIDPQAVAMIVDHGLECGDPELSFYRSVLSGVLDPDKLDYMNRDAYFCGVPYGIQDLDFILGNIRVHQGRRIAIEQAGLSSIEHLLFSKYLMYRAVYWHRQVRTATAMIKRALFIALHEGKIKPDELYHLDDARFIALAENAETACPALHLVGQVSARQLLTTVLEHPFHAGNPAMSALLDLDRRHQCEAEIARRLSRGRGRTIEDWEVVIDIPEAVSFESDMPVLTPAGPMAYLDSGTVFTAGVVKDFTASLRVLRVMAAVEPESITRDLREELGELAGIAPPFAGASHV